MTTLAENIRASRQAAGLSLAELSRRSKVSKTYLWEIEKGVSTNVGAECLRRIATVLGTSVDRLLTGTEIAAGLEIKLSGRLALLADTKDLSFNQVAMLRKVGQVIQDHQPFPLNPPEPDWSKLCEALRPWL